MDYHNNFCFVLPLSLTDDISVTEILYKMQYKINELVDVVNKLEQRVQELEQK